LTAKDKVDLDDVSARIVRIFPTLDSLEQRLSLELYRLLAEGEPIPRELLSERLEVPLETVNQILNAWPGVFSDSQQRVVGYWVSRFPLPTPVPTS
jgi:hypothetical protein